MSVAYLTTLNGLPFMSRIGLYEAWIQTSRPPLPMRLNSAGGTRRVQIGPEFRYSGLRLYGHRRTGCGAGPDLVER